MVNTFKTWWRRLAPLPLGKWLFSKALALLIPYTGTISPFVLEVSPGYARVRMSDKRRIRNHLSSIHALSLANLGELTTGLALHFALKDQQRAILTNLSAEYHKKARGPITAIASIKNLDQALVGPIEVNAQLFDKNLVLVTSVKALWLAS
jgi:acyl-coenzyme A thioesterase PaaI-like protein